MILYDDLKLPFRPIKLQGRPMIPPSLQRFLPISLILLLGVVFCIPTGQASADDRSPIGYFRDRLRPGASPETVHGSTAERAEPTASVAESTIPTVAAADPGSRYEFPTEIEQPPANYAPAESTPLDSFEAFEIEESALAATAENPYSTPVAETPEVVITSPNAVSAEPPTEEATTTVQAATDDVQIPYRSSFESEEDRYYKPATGDRPTAEAVTSSGTEPDEVSFILGSTDNDCARPAPTRVDVSDFSESESRGLQVASDLIPNISQPDRLPIESTVSPIGQPYADIITHSNLDTHDVSREDESPIIKPSRDPARTAAEAQRLSSPTDHSAAVAEPQVTAPAETTTHPSRQTYADPTLPSEEGRWEAPWTTRRYPSDQPPLGSAFIEQGEQAAPTVVPKTSPQQIYQEEVPLQHIPPPPAADDLNVDYSQLEGERIYQLHEDRTIESVSACDACGGTECCGPNKTCRASRWSQSWISLQTTIDGFKSPIDLDNLNGNFGTRFALNGAVPVLPRLGIGLQGSWDVVLSDFHGSQYATDDNRVQSFTTVGAFQKIDIGCESRFRYGFGYDWYHDEYYSDLNFNQWRIAAEVEFSRFNQIGFWYSRPDQGDTLVMSADTPGLVLERFRPVEQYMFYFDHEWRSGATTRLRLGFAEEPVEMIFGLSARMPLDDHISLVGDFTYMKPSARAGALGQTEETWNVSFGVELVFGEHRRCNVRRRPAYRPLLTPAGNSIFSIRRM